MYSRIPDLVEVDSDSDEDDDSSDYDYSKYEAPLNYSSTSKCETTFKSPNIEEGGGYDRGFSATQIDDIFERMNSIDSAIEARRRRSSLDKSRDAMSDKMFEQMSYILSLDSSGTFK